MLATCFALNRSNQRAFSSTLLHPDIYNAILLDGFKLQEIVSSCCCHAASTAKSKSQICPIKIVEKAEAIQIEECTIFIDLFHLCTNWAKASFPPTEMECVVNCNGTVTCLQPTSMSHALSFKLHYKIAFFLRLQSIMWFRLWMQFVSYTSQISGIEKDNSRASADRLTENHIEPKAD